MRVHASIASPKPSVSSTSNVRDCNPCARDFLIASASASMMRKDTPRAARSLARVNPTGPAPTMRMSVSFCARLMCASKLDTLTANFGGHYQVLPDLRFASKRRSFSPRLDVSSSLTRISAFRSRTSRSSTLFIIRFIRSLSDTIFSSKCRTTASLVSLSTGTRKISEKKQFVHRWQEGGVFRY
jgi:hypothetical protein